MSHGLMKRTTLCSSSHLNHRFLGQKALRLPQQEIEPFTIRVRAIGANHCFAEPQRIQPTSQLSSLSNPAARSRKQATKRVTTFTPFDLANTDAPKPEAAFEEGPSFLQQKAKAVANRRAAAASLSSMTGAEKAAFDDIWKLFEPSGSPAPPEPKPTDQTDTDFRNLLELFESLARNDQEGNRGTSSGTSREELDYNVPRRHPSATNIDSEATIESLIDGIDTEAASSSVQKQSTEAENIDAAAVRIVEDVSSSFNAALKSTGQSPEIAMWEVCEQKVFPLTKLLIPPEKKMTSKPTVSEPQPRPTHPLIPPHTPLIPLLSKVYPTTLLLALRLYQRHHPTSPYCLSLLPHIKSLGPTSYVLGANTHFYNTLLAIRWDFYSDLDEISNLLAEMDRTGLEYDGGTAELLKRINSERECDMHEHPYDRSVPERRERGAQWWKQALVDRSWKRFLQRKALVARQLEEKGLGEVMREGAFDGYEAVDVRPVTLRAGYKHSTPAGYQDEQPTVTL